jgi:hypothetical protein
MGVIVAELAFVPGTQNQWWSRWTLEIAPGVITQRELENVDKNIKKFARQLHGDSTEVNVLKTMSGGFVADLLIDSPDPWDLRYLEYAEQCWRKFLTNGFGLGTQLNLHVRKLRVVPTHVSIEERVGAPYA